MSPLFKDGQVRSFLGLLGVLILTAFFIETASGVREGTNALRFAAVNVTSILTGTGYATTAYDGWGSVAVALFFFIMFIGGCAGSTSCGIKIFRFQVLFQNLRQHLAQVIYPHGIFTQRFNGRPISDNVVSAVISFFFLYMLTFAISAMALSLVGVDPVTALSGAGSAISNVGPGLGALIGPSGNYQPLPDAAKWILAVTMLIGTVGTVHSTGDAVATVLAGLRGSFSPVGRRIRGLGFVWQSLSRSWMRGYGGKTKQRYPSPKID